MKDLKLSGAAVVALMIFAALSGTVMYYLPNEATEEYAEYRSGIQKDPGAALRGAM
jgi:hypothetical protein